MDKDRIMKVTDANGVEHEMFILFTTSLSEFNKNYIFYYDPTDSNGQVFASSYDENSRLSPIENEEEWNQLEEVFNEFMKEAKERQCKNCKSDCNEDCDCEDCDCE